LWCHPVLQDILQVGSGRYRKEDQVDEQAKNYRAEDVKISFVSVHVFWLASVCPGEIYTKMSLNTR
jgi:hypothetical protein